MKCLKCGSENVTLQVIQSGSKTQLKAADVYGG